VNNINVILRLVRQLSLVMLQSLKIGARKRSFLAGFYWAYVRIKCSFFPVKRNLQDLSYTRELSLSCRQDLGMISESLSEAFVDIFLKQVEFSKQHKSLDDYFACAETGKFIRSRLVGIEGEHDLLKSFFKETNLIAIVMEYLDLNLDEIMFSAKVDSCVKLSGERHLRNGYDDALEYHRDVDSAKFVKVFVYLNDIEEGNGHHEIFLGSNRGLPVRFKILDRFKMSDIFDSMPGIELCRVVGAKGYSWIEDTTSLHRGTVPEFGNRLMLSLSFNDAKSTRHLYNPDEYYDLWEVYNDASAI